ncbi:hypothetical protein [Pseudactinotalea suaedae]|uniref:hypothetical protein n=1 Tax=Pseudactinotalea suaedae TaxID=1524924 RepID=UPI0012E27622|nr:hypothetical protein [Pseudactinotalea suaedae]
MPEQILGIAMDQRAFGPRRLMVALAAYDARFLGLLYTDRTDPIDDALEVCLLHAEVEGLRGSEPALAGVVLCDQPVVEGGSRHQVEAVFERAKVVAARHRVHLVDWIGCDDDTFRCARLRTLSPASEPGWWDVPAQPRSSPRPGE